MKTLLIFLFLIVSCLDASRGAFVVFTGISGSGKSSTARALAALCHAECYLEPEEDQWPAFIREKQLYGECAAYQVFRAMRVHALWQAIAKKEQGALIFSDSYYDKITSYYLGKPGMEWLIAPQDPYYPCIKMLAELDTQLLPNADCVILLDVPYDIWVERLQKRGRARDALEGFQESYQLYRSYIQKATEDLCREHHIPYFTVQANYPTVEEQAQAILDLLRQHRVITQEVLP